MQQTNDIYSKKLLRIQSPMQRVGGHTLQSRALTQSSHVARIHVARYFRIVTVLKVTIEKHNHAKNLTVELGLTKTRAIHWQCSDGMKTACSSLLL